MLALFSLRLALGMVACLPLLPARLVHPRYYRTHLLTALGLCGLALVLTYDSASAALLACLGTAVGLAFLGSVLWRVEGAPGGQLVIAATLVLLAAGAWLMEEAGRSRLPGGTSADQIPARQAGPAAVPPSTLVGDLTSAALLGTAVSAMLMGHSYLISPGMSLSPLLRLLGAFIIALLARLGADGFAVWRWTAHHPLAALGNDTLLWLPVRWLVGFAFPLGLCWMAWQSARIRSTQSATGILYVVVICCFLGELTALLLRDTGLAT